MLWKLTLWNCTDSFLSPLFSSVKQYCTCYQEAALQYPVSHHQRLCYTELHAYHSPWRDSLKFQMKQQVTSCLQESILSVFTVSARHTSASTTELIFPAAQMYRLHRGCYLYHWGVNKVSLYFLTILSISSCFLTTIAV